jgi:hypothetical protein
MRKLDNAPRERIVIPGRATCAGISTAMMGMAAASAMRRSRGAAPVMSLPANVRCRQEPGDEIEQRRFAGAVRPDNAEIPLACAGAARRVCSIIERRFAFNDSYRARKSCQSRQSRVRHGGPPSATSRSRRQTAQS